MSNFTMKHTEFVSFRKERCPIRTTLQNNSYVFSPYKKTEKGEKKRQLKQQGKDGGKEEKKHIYVRKRCTGIKEIQYKKYN